MKNIIVIISILAVAKATGQGSLAPTNSLRISGQVIKPMTLTLSAFDTLKKTTIGDLMMLDKKGGIKEKNVNVKGVLLRDLFQNIEFATEIQKSLNKFYLVFSATDGFKLVLSWNEIFHTKSCTNFYVITDKDGKKLSELSDRIMIVEVSDSNTGHKRIESLDNIFVQEAN